MGVFGALYALGRRGFIGAAVAGVACALSIPIAYHAVFVRRHESMAPEEWQHIPDALERVDAEAVFVDTSYLFVSAHFAYQFRLARTRYVPYENGALPDDARYVIGPPEVTTTHPGRVCHVTSEAGGKQQLWARMGDALCPTLDTTIDILGDRPVPGVPMWGFVGRSASEGMGRLTQPSFGMVIPAAYLGDRSNIRIRLTTYLPTPDELNVTINDERLFSEAVAGSWDHVFPVDRTQDVRLELRVPFRQEFLENTLWGTQRVLAVPRTVGVRLEGITVH
jgi:hypothetical protein